MADTNKIQKQLGLLLLNGAINNLRAAYKVTNPTVVSYGKITDLAREAFPNIGVSHKDTSFMLAPKQTWINFFNELVLDRMDYYADAFDCDNYAFLSSSFSSLFLLLNSCGVAHCTAYRKDTGELVSGHFLNLITTSDDGVYLFDLNNRNNFDNFGYVKVVKGVDPFIGNWIYRAVDRVEFY